MSSPQEVVAVAYERCSFTRGSGFDWGKLGVLDRWSLTSGGRTWRLPDGCYGMAKIEMDCDLKRLAIFFKLFQTECILQKLLKNSL